ncbi:MAG TPA: hypothetical protein DCE42_04020 [Myxococcales bacterium]|nr:hypothetical protein [Deltaproteobacteria bacterium]HAA53893.1 hypothetical protein [Myxococcales bacterium]|tara:strand:- start:6946 stop:7686 length:741 start_codon:yes stop_codon:yes gene_type:complete
MRVHLIVLMAGIYVLCGGGLVPAAAHAKGKVSKRQSDLAKKKRTLTCRFARKKGKKSRTCRRFAKKKKPNEIFIAAIGKRRRFYLCRGGRLLRSYPAGHGRRGYGKQREGDKKTPIGSYRISWMAARHEPKRPKAEEEKLQRFQIRDKRAYCKPDPKTKFSHFRRKDGPRDERLWRRPYGGKRATVMAINYPNEKDMKAGKTGSCIEIHASYHVRTSAGCVLLWPKHIFEVYNCVAPGTRVELRYR